MANIEINGIQIEARDGAMLIEAADEAGITIPRFCYHKKLSIAANCRMCLVEVEKAPKPLPACATPVTDGMKVFTKSPKALEAQKSIMEFLLINHPLDCPICDQGGECTLQDLAMGYGKDVSRFSEQKRVVPDKNLGSLVATDMTRCIHCTRCVRFGKEIAGIMELGATGRGEHTEIGTYVERAVTSEMSGNVIDLCPVGALTSKPYRYSGRPWENQQHNAIAPHDCVGSNIIIETRRNRVMRVLPKENEAINETWISDRDRFSYTALYSESRLQQPMIKQGDTWKPVDWETALAYAVEGFKRVIASGSANDIGALVSSSATLEELYLSQKLLRGLGSSNIDHRLRQTDFSDQDIEPVAPILGQSLVDLEQSQAALLIGSNVRKDQPMVAHRLRKASNRGANIMFINALDYDFNFPVAENIVTTPAGMVLALAAVAKSLLDITGASAPEGLAGLLENVDVHDDHLSIAKHLNSAEQASVLIGLQSFSMDDFAQLRTLANLIAELSSAKLGYLSAGANSVGAGLAGALPHRGVGGTSVAQGRHAADMIENGLRGCLLMGVEPEFDCARSGQALKMVHDADFVVSLSAYISEEMKQYADVLLPIALFAETSGTYVNAEGNWQSFAGSVSPVGDARPAWKILRVLGNLFELAGFDYVTSEEIRDELNQQVAGVELSARSLWRPIAALPAVNGVVRRIGYLPLYNSDPLVRRSKPLQSTYDALPAAAFVNEQMAAQLGVAEGDMLVASQNDYRVELPVTVDEAVPAACVLIPQSVSGTEGLSSPYGEIELSKK